MKKTLALPALAFLFAACGAATAALAKYPVSAQSCGGFPQVQVATMDGTCLGLVVQSDSANRLVKPRKLAQVTGRDAFLLTDMGGWDRGKGSLLLLEKHGNRYLARVLMSDLNLPHQILRGPDGRYYLGEAHRIQAFDLNEHGDVKNVVTVISDLPDAVNNLHPLTHFIFLANGDLLVNIGASSDNCAAELATGTCKARETSGILRLYRHLPGTASWSSTFEVYARGLRNSMALVQHTSGTILQAENSIDFKAAGEPYEEINLIERDGDYGWPYCYDNDAPHPDWNRADACRSAGYHRPWILMPPHAAPLDMIYYTGTMFPELTGRLLVGWHGYRLPGHRLVAYAVDESGRPLRDGRAAFRIDPVKGGPASFSDKSYSPHGTALPASQHIELINEWNAVEGVRPKGAPVGLVQAEDGSIWIVDDKNAAVLRLARGTPWRSGAIDVVVAPTPVFREDPDQSRAAVKILQIHCAACHDFLKTLQDGGAARTLAAEGWLSDPMQASKLATVLASRSMPPEQALPDSENATLRSWVAGLVVESAAR